MAGTWLQDWNLPRHQGWPTCKVGQKLGVPLPLLTCSPSVWPSRLLYRRGWKSWRDLWITLYIASRSISYIFLKNFTSNDWWVNTRLDFLRTIILAWNFFRLSYWMFWCENFTPPAPHIISITLFRHTKPITSWRSDRIITKLCGPPLSKIRIACCCNLWRVLFIF